MMCCSFCYISVDLTICLVQNSQFIPPTEISSNDSNIISNILETRNLNRHLVFSEVNDISSSNYEMCTSLNVSVKDIKSILKITDSSNWLTEDKL